MNGLDIPAKGLADVPRQSLQLVAVILSAPILLQCAAGCNLAGAVPKQINGAAPDATKTQLGDDGPPQRASNDAAAALGGEDWVETIPPRDPISAASAPADRWRHPGLEIILADGDARARLQKAMKYADRVGATNASIGLAQFDDAKVLPRLVETARDPKFKLATRGAAIQAIGKLSAPAADDALGELAADLGQPHGAAKARYAPELHADLVRAIGQRPAAENEDLLHVALASPAASVRLEAVRAFSMQGRTCPAQAADLMADDAASVRAAAVCLLAEHGHPQAQDLVASALNDYDLTVRLAAIEALGRLPAEENGRRLKQLMGHSADLVRATAVMALSRRGDFPAVRQSAGDKSWRVRYAVAECLAGLPARERGELAGALLRDASIDVQRRMVDVLAEWPLEESVPLLLKCLEGRSAATRRAAVAQLRTRWAAADGLPAQASPERHAEEARRLRIVWDDERKRG